MKLNNMNCDRGSPKLRQHVHEAEQHELRQRIAQASNALDDFLSSYAGNTSSHGTEAAGAAHCKRGEKRPHALHNILILEKEIPRVESVDCAAYVVNQSECFLFVPCVKLTAGVVLHCSERRAQHPGQVQIGNTVGFTLPPTMMIRLPEVADERPVLCIVFAVRVAVPRVPVRLKAVHRVVRRRGHGATVAIRAHAGRVYAF